MWLQAERLHCTGWATHPQVLGCGWVMRLVRIVCSVCVVRPAVPAQGMPSKPIVGTAISIQVRCRARCAVLCLAVCWPCRRDAAINMCRCFLVAWAWVPALGCFGALWTRPVGGCGTWLL